MKKLTYSLLPLGITVGLCLNIAPASAGMIVQNVIPNAALSIDGFGSLSNNGVIRANIPTGSTIQRAYLYAASIWDMSQVYEVTFNGTKLLMSSATILTPADNNLATTARWDVTSIIASSFTGGLQDFSIVEDGDNDGEVLVVAYSNPSTQGLTSVILDGELNPKGDTVKFDFPAPYAGGAFLVSLASSYSRQPSGQATEIDVTTNSTNIYRRLTSSAGGQDDGEGANGALITVGGIGDSPDNPDPCASPSDGPRIDDEYYNLALGNSSSSSSCSAASTTPFILPGNTFVEFKTVNPSEDDNVFGMFITSKFGTSPSPVPEPSMTLGIFGIGGIGILLSRLGKKS
ncbi:MAG: PEP-CTERM sorting domain-containing protein [Microcystis aeruginosa PMC 728.11]|nr:PEP-CTERM sorting domain-containing protein [Microcystis aeruginosa PMC 728.11]